MYRSRITGFTIVELIVVMAIISIIAGLTFFGFTNYAHYQHYDQAVGSTKAAIIDARVRARSSETVNGLGIKVLTDSIVVFQGTSYNALASTNRTTDITGAVLTSAFSNGINEIVFNNLTGLPNATGTILIESTEFNASTTVEITATGVIQ
jgi:prepilin-type N-terminal cleavage/methylation domain-containing protein